ncbi:photosystem II complex extrinsic protein PsbU [Crocosphaera sp.]|uniref:photosystem II complex extrinsic protein PsbU n=1 Tax=Crocosphaera sp. TaxID=2729996 RepID=UPI002622F079|nr:photosystem II complex extrinsic protein PsbU [Crocosphaera sp.]MDJ0578659.1 photosystem II complex extrinsic protein PsbU [Crocosphaera sp.]
MKTLVRLFAILMVLISSVGFVGSAVAAELNPVDSMLTTEFGQKIDLNNDHIRQFRDLRGFYPNLAAKIIKYAPYDTVEEVLDIPGLSDRQKQRLESNLDKFVVTPPADELNEGGDRLNPGLY